VAASFLAAMFPFALLGLLLNLITFDIGGGAAGRRRQLNMDVFLTTVALVSGSGSIICGALFFRARSRARRDPSHDNSA
jgi:hypothetical protein